MSEHSTRRTFLRVPLYAAIGIETSDRKDRAGITRNVSAGGLFFHSMSRFSLGERLRVTYRDPTTRQDTHLDARVVRVASDLPSSGSSFPHLCAVEFERPVAIRTVA
jgi:hypothetical protein